jgi:hypothetical protein
MCLIQLGQDMIQEEWKFSGDLMYYGIDASVKYSFMSLINSKVIDPSYMLVEVILFGDSSGT